MEGRWPAPFVRDLDGEIGLRDRHFYEDGQLCLVAVAVLQGVQCRLSHRGLEPLQGSLRQTQPAHRPGNLLHRSTIVARLAGYAQLGERTAGAAAGCRHNSSILSRVTRVMSFSCSHPSLVKERSSSIRKSTSDSSSPCSTTSLRSRGRPNISRWGSWASIK